MKYYFTYFFLCCSVLLQAQKITVLSLGRSADSSLYHIQKMGPDDFWIAGKYGLLLHADTTGNITTIPVPEVKASILKTIKTDSFIFLITNAATLHRYDLIQQTWLKKEFPELRHKCFYDILLQQNGKLLISGGNEGIAKGKKEIPKGFILSIGQEMGAYRTIWHRPFKFVWSLAENQEGKVFAASFNGHHSKIIRLKNNGHWKREACVRGLVYKLLPTEEGILYSGARSIKYDKDGIYGMLHHSHRRYKGSGCFWSIDTFQHQWAAITAKGQLLLIDKKTNAIKEIVLPSHTSLYSMVKLSDTQLMIVGHHAFVCIVEMD